MLARIGTVGTVEAVSDTESVLVTGGDSVEVVAVWIGGLGLDFSVTGPPPLSNTCRVLSDRYARAIDRRLQAGLACRSARPRPTAAGGSDLPQRRGRECGRRAAGPAHTSKAPGRSRACPRAQELSLIERVVFIFLTSVIRWGLWNQLPSVVSCQRLSVTEGACGHQVGSHAT